MHGAGLPREAGVGDANLDSLGYRRAEPGDGTPDSIRYPYRPAQGHGAPALAATPGLGLAEFLQRIPRPVMHSTIIR